MLEEPVYDWWLIVLRGMLALSLGLLLLPVCERVPALINLFIGIYFIADGILAVLIAIVNRSKLSNRWWLIADGGAGIIAGILITGFTHTSDMLPFPAILTILVWSLLTGIFEIVVPLLKKGEMPGRWIFITGGLLSVLLGISISVILNISTAMVVTTLVSYLIALGILFLILGFSVRNIGE